MLIHFEPNHNSKLINWNGDLLLHFVFILIVVGFLCLIMWGRMDDFDYLIVLEHDEPLVMCH